MLEKESTKLEDSLTAMVRINKENEEIDRKKEIEKIKKQAQIEIQLAKEEKNTKIQELEKELEKLKKLYEEKLKAKEKQKKQQEESQLTEEIEKFKMLLEETNILEDQPKIGIDEINEQNSETDLDRCSETSETYTNLIEKEDNIKINVEDVEDVDEKPSTSGTKSPKRVDTSPIYYTYERKNRSKTLRDKRLNENWIPRQNIEQYNFLDLDCVADTNKTIQLWIGYISKQLIDNKISVADYPGYIERTLMGTTKIWLQNLSPESLETLRNNKKSNNEPAVTPIDILNKYEMAIRNEFSSMTTEIDERQKEKELNRNLINKLSICKMSYIDEYTCAFKEYYYKGLYTNEESKEIRKLYYTKLPEPFSSKITKEWQESGLVDTLGARIKFLQKWFTELCEKHKEDIKMEKILIKNLACCTTKTAPQFGCTNKYKYKKRIKKYMYKPFRTKYKYKQSRKRYYIKNYKQKRPHRTKKNITECKCYNCGKIGHLARECKIPRNPTKKQVSEVIIGDEKYKQLEYIDYELNDDDSIYEITEYEKIDSENEIREYETDDDRNRYKNNK